ncbi:MAG TPA: response regulator [Anaerolineales bacterium]|nr:response regulator [Anaerolineales bacterium]
METHSDNHKHILIIDDDPDQRLTIRLPLESAGYYVTEATNPAEALKVIKVVKPDLIVLDVMMDTTTAGFQVALELHSPDPQSEYKEFRQTPIIMLTAIHSTTPLRFSPDSDYLPVQTFLEKPVDSEVLLAKVREYLGQN